MKSQDYISLHGDEDESVNHLKSDFKEDSPIIDQIINEYGYGYKTIIQIIIFLFSTFVEGMIMSLFSILVIPIQIRYNLSDSSIQIISSSIFLGACIGAFISAFVSDWIGRTKVVKLSLLLVCLLQYSLGLSQNIFIFSILRFLCGVFNGIQLTILSNLITEYLPTRLRCLAINCAWSGFNITLVITLLIMLSVMPNLEPEKISEVIYLASIQLVIIFIFVCIFMRDSPRNLILNKKDDEAFQILEEYHGNPLNQKDKLKIISQVTKWTNNNTSGILSDLFTVQELTKTTILISLGAFFTCLMFFGPSLILSLTLKSLGQESNKSNRDIIIEQIIANLPSILFQVVGGMLSEIKVLGRLNTMMLTLAIGNFTLLISCFYPSKFALLFGIYLGLVSIPYSMISIYTTEVYPTKLRDLGQGFNILTGKFGAFISQPLYVMLHRIEIFMPYYFTAGVGFVCLFLIYLLPYETYERPLDSEYTTKCNANKIDDDDKVE